MLDRMQAGELPKKPHTQFWYDPADGTGGRRLLREHCLTRVGFEGPFTIAYRLFGPHVQTAWSAYELPAPELGASEGDAGADLCLRRHYQSQVLGASSRSPIEARVPLLTSSDVTIAVMKPTASDTRYLENGDGDDLYYIHEGGGTLRTILGDVAFGPGDYVFVPRGLVHRFDVAAIPQHWLLIEAHRDLHIPRQFRNEVGQLRMDAPYTHRDFRRPDFRGPVDEGIREVLVKREGKVTRFTYPESPLDVVGWDGSVWPWAFPILAFQPKVSSVHLPPTIHGTFAIGGGLVCSFVPRVTDFHPDAIPCPYPHASVHCDEVIFYCKGNFTSRKGVGPGSVSFHPMGTSHGPHPGSYEASIGHARTDELAVMLDVFLPLRPTAYARALEDRNYHASFVPAELLAKREGERASPSEGDES
ncbi:MAG: homogentisate 1,2-dioxygenase [Deltaproteobacteria bacterium]|nr:homogentisate 1,2-dioxygenase [Deltaproteobacteria bacterium]